MPRVVRGGSERNSGSSPDNDVDVSGYVGGSRRSDELRRRCGIDGEGRRDIASGESGTKGAWRRREKLHVGGDRCV